MEKNSQVVVGKQKDILNFLGRAVEEGLLLDLDDLTLYKEEEDFDAEEDEVNLDLNYAVILTEKLNQLEEEINDLEVKDIKRIRDYEKIQVSSIENQIPLKKMNNKLYIGKSNQIVLRVSNKKSVQKSVIKLLHLLTGGNLSSVRVRKVLTKNRESLYIEVEYISQSSYLYELKQISESKDLEIFYPQNDRFKTLIEMGYRCENDLIISNFLDKGNNIFIKRADKGIETISDYYETAASTALKLVDFKLKKDNEKEIKIRSRFSEISEDENKVEIPLSIKKSYVEEVGEKLDEKINILEQDLDDLREVREMNSKRQNSAQLVIINYEYYKDLGQILAYLPKKIVDEIKIAVFEIEEKSYYAIYIKNFRIKKSNKITKIYNLDRDFSHHNLEIFLEENKHLYPFYIKEKIEDLKNIETDLIEEDAYYNMFLSDDDIEVSNGFIETIKKEKMLVLLDNSKDIFRKRNMILFKFESFKNRVIEFYNKNLLKDSKVFESEKMNNFKKNELREKELKNIEDEGLELYKVTLKEVEDIFKALTHDWNNLSEELDRTQSKIIGVKEEIKPKVDNLLINMKKTENLEDIEQTFSKYYSKLVKEAKKNINIEEAFTKTEDEMYLSYKGEWAKFNEKNKNRSLEYEKYNNKRKEEFEKENIDREKKLKATLDHIKSMKSMILKAEKEIEGVLDEYEK